jgi:hypothetical protein
VVLLSIDRPLTIPSGLDVAALGAGLTLSAANIVSLRWVSDRLKDSSYGEIIRARDPDEGEVSLPYLVVAISGFATALVAILDILVHDSASRDVRAVILSIELLFGLYSVLGSLSLLRVSARHQRRYAKLQAIKEAQERDDRRSKSA